MYLVVTIRDDSGDFICHGRFETLEGAKNARQVSGDLVYNVDGTIVDNTDWLWDWERNSIQYAGYRIANPIKLGMPIGY